MNFKGVCFYIEKRIEGSGALNLLHLLEQLDKGKTLTPEIQEKLCEIAELDLANKGVKHIPTSIKHLTNLKELNLQCNNLFSLPESLCRLSNLQTLDISENPLSSLPDSLDNLSNLQTLDISENPLSFLPDSLGNLSNLQALYISSNNLLSLPDSLGNLSNLQALYINGNNLLSLPNSLGNLSNLQELYISSNNLSSLPDSLGNLSNLQLLDIICDNLSFLPDSLGNLSNLQTLYINGNNLSSLPNSLGNLSNLQALDIIGNNLSSLPDSLGNLSKLQTLDIRDNNLSSLPDSLGNLSNLQVLGISENSLSSLPESLGNLSSLQTLGIFDSKLSSLPESLGNLSNLRTLNITNNKLSSLPESLGNLSNLKALSINENSLSSLPESLGNLSNLQTLGISENPLSSLPDSLGRLFNLQWFDISYTKIETLSPRIASLKRLQSLNLSGLNLRYLPAEILDLNLPFGSSLDFFSKDGTGIELYKTTLSTQPISLFEQPRELIQAYFDSPKIPVHETKVIFLGDGGAGKTHTIHRIQNNCQLGEYHTEMTPGVEITSFQTQNNDLTLNFWDFGGQEIMPSIHRCFLTQRALYVVVVSTRTGNLTVQARHWLKTIEAFAPGAPVLIAVNCWDNTTSCGVNNELLYEEFPNLRQTVIFSAKCSSQEEFYQNLLSPIEELSRKMDSYSMELPESWFHIEQALRTQKNPYITGSDYLQICRENGLEDEQIAQWLLEWFNDMGACFSYSDDNGQPYQVLRPEWLTNAVYRILLEEKEPNSDGIVKRKYIERSLSYPGSGTQPEITYTQSECNAILAVMEKFRLSYSINEQELFIPALCSEKKPVLLIPENCEQRLEYELQYAYLPDCVVHQLMIWYLESNITPKHVWRSGLCVQERTRWAVITGDFHRAKLHIQLYMQPDSSAQNCHDMLRDIYQAIREINKRLALEASDCIIMHEGNQTAHFPLGPLLEAKKKGWTELPSLEDGEFHVYNVDQILDSAFNPQQVQAALKQERQNNFSGTIAPAIYMQNLTNQIQIGWSAEDVQTFTSAFLERQDLLTEEVITKLIDLLCHQEEVILQQLGQKMAKSKTPVQQLKDFISNTAKTGKDIQTLSQLLKAIYAAAPAILEAVQKWLF